MEMDSAFRVPKKQKIGKSQHVYNSTSLSGHPDRIEITIPIESKRVGNDIDKTVSATNIEGDVNPLSLERNIILAQRFEILQKLVNLLCRTKPTIVKLSLLERMMSSILGPTSNVYEVITELVSVAPALIKVAPYEEFLDNLIETGDTKKQLYLYLSTPLFNNSSTYVTRGRRTKTGSSGDDTETARRKYFEECLRNYNPTNCERISILNNETEENSKIRERPQSINDLLILIRKQSFYNGQIVPKSIKICEKRDPVWAKTFNNTIGLGFDIKLISGVERLYEHQANAIECLYNKRNVILNTSTSSGKSLVYQTAIIDSLLKSRDTCHIVIFPTKALIHDQKGSLESIVSRIEGLEEQEVYTFDGDSSTQERKLIREKARVVFTNPDIIHCSLLPNHREWSRILSNLKLIVIDELHCYTSEFGSNIAAVFRRLRRICSLYNNTSIAYMGCSATAPRPMDLFVHITGVDSDSVEVIDKDASPSGKQTFIMWECGRNGHTSNLSESEHLALFFARNIQHFSESNFSEFTKYVKSYRGGYTASDRRAIENDMFQEKTLCIIATSALELGVNIGSVGLPYDTNSYLQRCGRAGRRSQESLIVMLLDSKRPECAAYINSPWLLHEMVIPSIKIMSRSKKSIINSHIECIAYEHPVEISRDYIFFELSQEELLDICLSKLIKHPSNNLYYLKNRTSMSNPALELSIRGSDNEEWRIIDAHNGKTVEVMGLNNAVFTIYEQSVFLVNGKTFFVKDIVHEDRLCLTIQVDVPYITFSRDYTDVNPSAVVEKIIMENFSERSNNLTKLELCYGEVQVITNVFGFTKRSIRNQRDMGSEFISDSIPHVIDTYGTWLDYHLEKNSFSIPRSIHAAEHLLIRSTYRYTNSALEGYPLLQTECRSPLDKRIRPLRIILYNTFLPRKELCHSLLTGFKDILVAAVSNISRCECDDGCTMCICLGNCKEQNKAICKQGAKMILKLLYEFCFGCQTE